MNHTQIKIFQLIKIIMNILISILYKYIYFLLLFPYFYYKKKNMFYFTLFY